MRQKKEDLVILTKAEYNALGKELARAHMINLRYQARCTCKIDFKSFVSGPYYCCGDEDCEQNGGCDE